MFRRNTVPAFVALRAEFAQRKPAEVQASRDVPAHIAAEWTGDNRPQSAAERVRAILGN